MFVNFSNRKLLVHGMTAEQKRVVWGQCFNKVRNVANTYYKFPAFMVDLVQLVDQLPRGELKAQSEFTKESLDNAVLLNERRLELMEEARKVIWEETSPALPKDFWYPKIKVPTPLQTKALAVSEILPALLLNFDMGLGKTLTAVIRLANEYKRRGGKFFIIAPAKLLYNFYDEIKESYPSLAERTIMLVYSKAKNLKLLLAKEWSVCIISYARMRTLKTIIIQHFPKVTGGIFDEGWFLSNKSKQYKYALEIVRKTQWRLRIVCSGTTPSKEEGMWQIMQFITPFAFPNRRRVFLEDWCYPVVKQFNTDYEFRDSLKPEFAKRIASYVIRGDFDKEAPHIPKSEHKRLYAPLEPKALKLYNDMMVKYLAEYNPREGVELAAEGFNRLKRDMFCDMLCTGFFRHEDGTYHDVHTAKLETLGEFLDRLPKKEQCVIVATHAWSYSKIKEMLGTDIEFFGLTPQKDHHHLTTLFKDNHLRFLGIHPMSGGIGLNFANGRYVIWFEQHYSGPLVNQTNGRVRRLDTFTHNPSGRTFIVNILAIKPTGGKLIDTAMLKVAEGKITKEKGFYDLLVEQQKE